ncbi:hypothetical protein [Thermodesulfovibrio thiophilus]|uniref:hypothetical protein n=1 Tax=Thermodesulfovibrio thiophilus TaxID=340095 RepID=UPI0017BECC59|nr:hypothetical protein [Thermodesulfovibrio thiophilus]HHW19963.1 hypothetical protein [Thermodesulfovibrio thiophilus]
MKQTKYSISITAKLVVEILKQCMKVYGIPTVIRTYQGSAFITISFQNFYSKIRDTYWMRYEFT